MDEMTIGDIQRKIDDGSLTARKLIQAYLERIKTLDKKGPAVNAIMEINPDALSIADSLDKEHKQKSARGPLHGVPILVKDNIDTGDKMQTTAGSLALADSKALKDAFIVKRLREAGVLIMGKTNLSEWAGYRSSRANAGWSSRGGLTHNPYATDRTASGSSSGSGVAVAANFCPAAIGTDTGGSIIGPAAVNGLVGIRPTVGLVSRSGVIPLSHSKDTIGPITTTVSDAAIVLSAIAGVDPEDQVTQESEGKSYPDYTQFLDKDGLRGVRVGVARNLFEINDKVGRILNDSIETMKKLGAEIIDPANIETAARVRNVSLAFTSYEFKVDIAAYLEKRGTDTHVRTLKEIIEFNNKNRERVMPYFGQDRLLQSEATDGLKSKKYLQLRDERIRLTRTEGIDATLKKYNLDAIFYITCPPPNLIDLINGDAGSGSSSTTSASAGYPQITVPAGYVFGLPVNISFFAGAYTEPALFRMAYAFEQATRVRRPPQFLPTANLNKP